MVSFARNKIAIWSPNLQSIVNAQDWVLQNFQYGEVFLVRLSLFQIGESYETFFLHLLFNFNWIASIAPVARSTREEDVQKLRLEFWSEMAQRLVCEWCGWSTCNLSNHLFCEFPPLVKKIFFSWYFIRSFRPKIEPYFPTCFHASVHNEIYIQRPRLWLQAKENQQDKFILKRKMFTLVTKSGFRQSKMTSVRWNSTHWEVVPPIGWW